MWPALSTGCVGSYEMVCLDVFAGLSQLPKCSVGTVGDVMSSLKSLKSKLACLFPGLVCGQG